MEKAKLILEYMRVLIWPILVVCLVMIYRKPVRRLVNSLADKFSQARKLTIGSLSFEIQERIADPALAEAVGELSAAAIAELLRAPRLGTMRLLSNRNVQDRTDIGVPPDNRLTALQELEDRKLVVFTPRTLRKFRVFVREFSSQPERSSEDFPLWILGPLPPPNSAELLAETYELTDDGRKASDAVIKTVSTLASGRADSQLT